MFNDAPFPSARLYAYFTLILGICIGLLFANWKTRKMD